MNQMSQSLTISLVQSDNVWENIQENLERLSLKIKQLKNDTDIIVLPELFSTGFTMEASKVAETMEGKGVSWMLEISKEKKCLVIGSLLIQDSDQYFNRLIVAFPDERLLFYDKRHLFSFAGEDKVFKSGEQRLVFEYKGFRICPLICYDLRFPVWARNTEAFDLLLFVANWPDARMLAWDTLLRARAIENLCYVAGLNRVGVDNNQLVYVGHSAVYDPMGETLVRAKPSEEAIFSTTINRDHIKAVRDKFSFLNDRDIFEIKND